jgi:hypothetical protein
MNISNIPHIAHLTMNSGHMYLSPRHQMLPESFTLLKPMVQRAGGPLPAPLSHYRVEIDRNPESALFTLFRGDYILLTAMLAWGENTDFEWDLIDGMSRQTMCPNPTLSNGLARPVQPTLKPWLAILLLPDLFLQETPVDVNWMGDFERCLAWSILAAA